MGLVAAVDALHYLFAIPLAILSVFLILVILVQRGRGGGLTGALGGMGGQSAFGTKAGDLFTRITIVVAAIWILLSMTALKVLNNRSQTAGLSRTSRSAPLAPGAKTLDGKTGTVPGGETPTIPGSTLPPAAPGSAPPAESPATSPPAEAPAATPPASPPATTPAEPGK